MSTNAAFSAIESAIADFLGELGVTEPKVHLEKPSDFTHGDATTNVALRYAKELEQHPKTVADTIAAKLTESDIPSIAEVSVAGPGFINISFSAHFYSELLEQIVSDPETYGTNNTYASEKWVVEHTSPNPNKAMHLGHLRNNLVGMSLVRILKANGAEVVSDAIDNNRGIAIAKLMWGFLSSMKKDPTTPTDLQHWVTHGDAWFSPQEKGMLPDLFVTECYVQGEAEFKASTDVEARVRDMVVAWEAKDADTRKLWEHVLSFAYEGMDRTLTRLGNHWDKVWHEHEHYQVGKSYVEQGLEKGVFQRLPDGAVLTDLEESHKLPDTILLKKDGTSLYITQDLALTDLKKKEYQADKLVWVVGPEQSTALKQLFACCEQLDIGTLDDFTHVPYGYVGLKTEDGGFKKMSSRAGTVVLIDDVIDGAKETIYSRLINERPDTPKDELVALAEKLALAAVKFAMLKSDRTQDLTFDTEQSVQTTGDSGVYVLYSYVRTQSILRKTENITYTTQTNTLGTEYDVLRQLLYYPHAVARAGTDLSIHHVAQYTLELAAAFNSWYAQESILDGSDKEAYKLAVTTAVAATLKNALTLVGIDTVEKI